LPLLERNRACIRRRESGVTKPPPAQYLKTRARRCASGFCAPRNLFICRGTTKWMASISSCPSGLTSDLHLARLRRYLIVSAFFWTRSHLTWSCPSFFRYLICIRGEGDAEIGLKHTPETPCFDCQWTIFDLRGPLFMGLKTADFDQNRLVRPRAGRLRQVSCRQQSSSTR
jgi:hypothetical protein